MYPTDQYVILSDDHITTSSDQGSELRVKRRAPAASDKASLSKPMTLSQLKATLSSLKKAQVNADEQIRKIASATSMLILAAKGASATDEEKKLVLESAQTADKADEAEEEDVVAQRNIDQVLARSEKRVRLLTARSKMVLRKLQAAERSP